MPASIAARLNPQWFGENWWSKLNIDILAFFSNFFCYSYSDNMQLLKPNIHPRDFSWFFFSSFPSILDNQCIRASYKLVSKTSSVFTSLCCYGYVCGPHTHHLSPGWTGALGSTNAIIIVSNGNSASNLNVWWLSLKSTCFIGKSGTRQTNQMQ